MSRAQVDGFRTGEVLATVFTGTLTERRGAAVEHLPTPQRLLDWLAVNGLAVARCTAREHQQALQLREAIHLAATAVATGSSLPAEAVRVINEAAGNGRAGAQLSPEAERTWSLGGPRAPGVVDALAVIAADAIAVLSSGARLALCASPSCRAVFVDTSHSRSRRWCDMNTCGNKLKKARYRGQSAADPVT